jgi:uncharacterized membrane protein YoaK (UPF0700 family)
MAETKRKTQAATVSEENEKMWLALLLAWVAGFADAFGFLKLKDIFFSAVSGNTVAVNASLAKRDWNEAARHSWPIIFFAGGLIFGAIFEKMAHRLRLRRRFSIALGIEGTLLLALAILGPAFSSPHDLQSGSPRFRLLVALLSGAMGVQTASLRRVRNESVNTPFVTGMLVRSIDNAVDALFNAFDRFRNREPEFPGDSMGKAIFHGALWFCFAIGAFCGGLGEIFWKFSALFFPMAVLALIIVCDLVRPIHD